MAVKAVNMSADMVHEELNFESKLLDFDDNQLAIELFGALGTHLAHIETLLGLQIAVRGSCVELTGTQKAVAQGISTLESLWLQLKAGDTISEHDVTAAMHFNAEAKPLEPLPTIETPRRIVKPRTPGQKAFMVAMSRSRLTFGIGPAGVGKTWLAVAQGLEAMTSGMIQRLVLVRPAVEAGERLGFLPGDMKDKIDPYLTPIYDALNDFLPHGQVGRSIANREIEIAPLAFMRGRSLKNCFIILDEAQNTTPSQMKMLLTRIGENSRMVVNGDLTQIDLPVGVLSGLRHARQVLSTVENISFVNFDVRDVVRDPLTAKIVAAYEKARDQKQ